MNANELRERIQQATDAADKVASERLHLHLLRLGARYERASLAEPRDFDGMEVIGAELAHLQGKFEDVDCGIMFRRGRNNIRRARGLEEVTGW